MWHDLHTQEDDDQASHDERKVPVSQTIQRIMESLARVGAGYSIGKEYTEACSAQSLKWHERILEKEHRNLHVSGGVHKLPSTESEKEGVIAAPRET